MLGVLTVLLFGFLAPAGALPCVDHVGLVVLRVADGDTVVVGWSGLPAPLAPELAIRVRGVDCPETHSPHCEAERAAGERATRFTREHVQMSVDRVAAVRICGWDKYDPGFVFRTRWRGPSGPGVGGGWGNTGNTRTPDCGGRVSGDVVFRDGTTLSEALLLAGHARPYRGHGARGPWCPHSDPNTAACPADPSP